MNEEIQTTVCAVFEIRNTLKSPKALYGVKNRRETKRTNKKVSVHSSINRYIYLRQNKRDFARKDYCFKSGKEFQERYDYFSN